MGCDKIGISLYYWMFSFNPRTRMGCDLSDSFSLPS